MRKFYLNQRIDTSQSLMSKGTPVQAIVLTVKETKKGYVVTCSPPVGCLYSERVFTSKPIKDLPKVRIGGEVTVFVDEVDCDGEYFVEVPI